MPYLGLNKMQQASVQCLHMVMVVVVVVVDDDATLEAFREPNGIANIAERERIYKVEASLAIDALKRWVLIGVHFDQIQI